jgi:hypothetical protein
MNNFARINHCKFIHYTSQLNPFLSYLPCIVRREYFSIIFYVKKCTLYSIKYGMCMSGIKSEHRVLLNTWWLLNSFCSLLFIQNDTNNWQIFGVAFHDTPQSKPFGFRGSKFCFHFSFVPFNFDQNRNALDSFNIAVSYWLTPKISLELSWLAKLNVLRRYRVVTFNFAQRDSLLYN